MTEMNLEQLAGNLFQGFRIDADAWIQAVKQGDIADLLSMTGEALRDSIGHPFSYVKEYVVAFLILGIGAALLKQVTLFFQDAKVQQLGFWIIYLITAKQFITLYYNGEQVASLCLERLVMFGNVFVPVFSAVLTFSAGSVTGAGYIAVLLFVIYLVEQFLAVILLPMAEAYMLLALLGTLWQKERVEKMMELFGKGISLGFRGIFLACGGIGMLQSMLLPYIDYSKAGAIKKVLEKIPALGGITSTSIEFAAGAVVLLKNGLGVLGVLLLLLVVFTPLLKISLLCVLLKTVSALYALFGEKKMMWCADKVCAAQTYVWKITFAATALFLIWILLAVYTTNQRLHI